MAKVDDTEQNAAACICPDCPTYNTCMGRADEKLYCSRGKTDCDPKARRCTCPDCPVWANYDLTSTYFCQDGAAL